MDQAAVPRRARATIAFEQDMREAFGHADTVGGAAAAAAAAANANAPTLGADAPVETHQGVGRPSLPSKADAIARAATRYQAVRILGEGGMGEVVLAHDVDIGRHVAIKRPHRDSARAAALLVSEVRTLGMLDHPNIVTVYDVDCDDAGLPYYTMKFQRGESLGDVLEKLRVGDPEALRRYSLSRRLDVFSGVLRALAHAHAQGIVHRDVKPDNVLVGHEGEVTLADWGIAVAAASHDADASAGFAGTPGYMSPEQARGEPGAHGPKSDLFSAFAMLYELLTLRPLVDPSGGALAVLHRNQQVDAPSPAEGAFGSTPLGPVPAEYRHYLRRGLAADPARRFASAEAALETLERVRSGEFPSDCPITAMKRVESAMTRAFERSAVFAMTAMVLVLGGFAGLVYAAIFR